MPGWYSRPVLAVRDAPSALDFYIGKLRFREDWRYEEEGRLRIAQVSREGCEVILSDQWPDDAGRGRLFISLDRPDFEQLFAHTKALGVATTSGHWGYELAVIEDPDGNRLWFPVPPKDPAAT